MISKKYKLLKYNLTKEQLKDLKKILAELTSINKPLIFVNFNSNL